MLFVMWFGSVFSGRSLCSLELTCLIAPSMSGLRCLLQISAVH